MPWSRSQNRWEPLNRSADGLSMSWGVLFLLLGQAWNPSHLWHLASFSCFPSLPTKSLCSYSRPQFIYAILIKMMMTVVINTLIGHDLTTIQSWEFVLCYLFVAGIKSIADVWMDRALGGDFEPELHLFCCSRVFNFWLSALPRGIRAPCCKNTTWR